MLHAIRVFPVALVFGAVLAACGGGGGGGGGTTIPGPPAVIPTLVPTSYATSAPVAAAASVVAGIRLGSATVSLAIPVASAGVGATLSILAYTSSTSFPALPQVSTGSPALAPLGYIRITASNAVTFATTPGFVASLAPSGGQSYYVALLSPNGTSWQTPYLGPATLSASAIDVAPFGVTTTLNANQPYTYALYSVPTPQFADDWTTYAHDVQRTGFEQNQHPSVAIASSNVGQLALAWSAQPNPACLPQALAANVIVDEASPLVANGFVYYADVCGYIAALNRQNGATVWHTQLALPAALSGPLGTPMLDVASNTLIVPVWGAGGANCPGTACVPAHGAYLAALDALSGALKWTSPPLPAGNMRGEPLVLGGSVYEGIAGGDSDSGSVNGGIAQYSLADGHAMNVFTFSSYGPGTGDGGSSWSPISYDQPSNTMFFGTGNTRSNTGIYDAVVGFNPTTFKPTTFLVPTHTTNLDEDVGGGELLWGGNVYFTAKSGYYYGYSLATALPLFSAPKINTYGTRGVGGIGTPTTDGNVIVASSGYNLGTYQSDLDCFQVASGSPFNKIQATNSTIYSYAAFVRGVGFIGIDNQVAIGTTPGPGGPAPAFVAFDDTCSIVWRANPLDVRSFFYAGPAVTQSGVYAVDNAGNVYAWKLPYQMGMQFAVRPEARAHASARVNLRMTRYARIRKDNAHDL